MNDPGGPGRHPEPGSRTSADDPPAHWRMGLYLLATGLVLTLLGVTLIQVINDLFEAIGFASRRGEAVVPFMAATFVLLAMVWFSREAAWRGTRTGGDSARRYLWYALRSVLLILMAFTAIEMVILVLVFFYAG